MNDIHLPPFRDRGEAAEPTLRRLQAVGLKRGMSVVVKNAVRLVRHGCSVLLLLMLQPAFLRAETSPAMIQRLRESAENGSSTAQYGLGLIYSDPGEPAADPAEAFVWLTLAVRNGASDRALNKLTAEATPAQLEEGRRRLAHYSEKGPSNPPIKVPPIKTSAVVAESPAPAAEPEPAKMVRATEPVPTRVPGNVEQELTNLRLDKKQLGAELALSRKETEAARKEAAAKLTEAAQQIERRERELSELKARAKTSSESTAAVVPGSRTVPETPAALEELTRKLAKKEEEADLLRTRLLAATSIRSPVSPDGEAGTGSSRTALDVNTEQLRRELAASNSAVASLKSQLEAERAAKSAGGSASETPQSAKLAQELERVRNEFKTLQASREKEARAGAERIDLLTRQIAEKDRSIRALEEKPVRNEGAVSGAAELAAKSRALQVAESAQEELSKRLSEERRERIKEAKQAEEERARVVAELEREREGNEKLRREMSNQPAVVAGGGEDAKKYRESEAERLQLAGKLASLSIEVASLKVQLATERDRGKSEAGSSTAELERTRRDYSRAASEIASLRLDASALLEKVAQLTAERDAALKQSAGATELANAQSRVETLERALAANESERRTLQSQLEGERSRSQDTAAQMSQLSAELTALRKSMVSARELAEARDEMETLRRALVTREIEAKSAAARLAQEQRRAEESAAELERVVAALADAKKRPGNQAEIDSLKNAVLAGERERDELNEKLVMEQKRNSVVSAQMEKLTADLESSRTQSISAEELTRLREELSVVRRNLAEAQTEQSTLSGQVETERRGRVDAAIRAGTLAAELDAVRRERVPVEILNEARADAENLRRALASSDSERERLSQQFAAAKRSYALQSQEFERAIKALANLDTERASLANQLSATRNETSRRGATTPSRPGDSSSANDQVSAELALLREQLRLTQQQSEELIREVNQMKTRATITPQGDIVLTTRGRPPSSIGEPGSSSRYHTVAEGDSLSSLARKYYGSPNRWADIEAANHDVIGNPNALRVGTRLKIP